MNGKESLFLCEASLVGTILTIRVGPGFHNDECNLCVCVCVCVCVCESV